MVECILVLSPKQHIKSPKLNSLRKVVKFKMAAVAPLDFLFFNISQVILVIEGWFWCLNLGFHMQGVQLWIVNIGIGNGSAIFQDGRHNMRRFSVFQRISLNISDRRIILVPIHMFSWVRISNINIKHWYLQQKCNFQDGYQNKPWYSYFPIYHWLC